MNKTEQLLAEILKKIKELIVYKTEEYFKENRLVDKLTDEDKDLDEFEKDYYKIMSTLYFYEKALNDQLLNILGKFYNEINKNNS